MKQEFPIRKDARLPDYDYSQPGYYFITICTAVRNQNVLCSLHNVGGGLCAAPQITLTETGYAVQDAIQQIPVLNPGAEVDIFSIMPDHIHLIIVLTGRHGDRPLHEILGRFKSYTDRYYRTHTPLFGSKLWQRGYYDHIIRSDDDLSETRAYIQNNPLKECDPNG